MYQNLSKQSHEKKIDFHNETWTALLPQSKQLKACVIVCELVTAFPLIVALIFPGHLEIN